MSEALKCFTFLVENVPVWRKNLEELEQKIKERHNEVKRIPVPVSQGMRRTGSNESIRPDQDGDDSKPIDTLSEPQANDVAHAQTTQQILLTKRKRKTESLLTSLSTPSKYRSRSSIVIYYDSTVQKSFEDLVQNINIGRNHIRKARMAARMEALTSASTLSGESDNLSIHLPAGSLRNGASSGYGSTLTRGLRSARGLPLRPDPGTDGYDSNATDACTLADQALDRAQTACEQGAHQFLRDGDCDEETSTAKENFLAVMTVSEKEIENLKSKEEERSQAREVQRQKEDERRKSESVDVHPGLMQSFGSHIEADDDEDDDEEYDSSTLSLPQFRTTTRT